MADKYYPQISQITPILKIVSRLAYYANRTLFHNQRNLRNLRIDLLKK